MSTVLNITCRLLKFPKCASCIFSEWSATADIDKRAMANYSTPKKCGQVVDMLTTYQVSKVFASVQ